jgi:hypothetical protein
MDYMVFEVAELDGATMICHTNNKMKCYLLVLNCRRFETGGSLGRRVSVAACPSPDGSSARASAKGGERGGRRPA